MYKNIENKSIVAGRHGAFNVTCDTLGRVEKKSEKVVQVRENHSWKSSNSKMSGQVKGQALQ
jgi:hypothetical protein